MGKQHVMWMIVLGLAGAGIGACSSDPDTMDAGMGGGGAGGDASSGGTTASGGATADGEGGLGGGEPGGMGGDGGSGPGDSSGGDTSTGGDTGSGGSAQVCSGTVPSQCMTQTSQLGCEAVGCNWNAMAENCNGMGGATELDCGTLDVDVCADVTGCTLN